MKPLTLPKRNAPHTHWLKAHFRKLSDQQVLLIQTHLLLGSSARAVATKMRCSIGTVYRAKNSVPAKHITFEQTAFSRVLERLVNDLRTKKPARLRAVKAPAAKKRKKRKTRKTRKAS